MRSQLMLLLLLSADLASAGFAFGAATRHPFSSARTPHPKAYATPTTKTLSAAPAERHGPRFRLPSLHGMLSWTGLAATTAGAMRVVYPLMAWQGVALVGACIAYPVATLGGQILFYGGEGVAKSMGGKPADARLVSMANAAAEAVGVPPPAHVYLIDRSEPNAFAAGMGHKDSTVAVTSGLEHMLTANELKAVLAHEMGHLRHHDVSKNMQIAVATAGIGGVYQAGRYMFDISGREDSSRSKKEDKDGGSLAGVGLGLMAAGMGTQAVAHLLRLGASRNAELKADRAAAEAFGADNLISALHKINSGAARHSDLRSSPEGKRLAFAMISDGPSEPDSSVAAAPSSTATKEKGQKGILKRMGNALRTHPPTDERVAALEMAVERGLVPRDAPDGGWALGW
jgi:Zn-dependent protease with chaperone function